MTDVELAHLRKSGIRSAGLVGVCVLLVVGLIYILATFGARGPEIIPIYDGAVLLAAAIVGSPLILFALKGVAHLNSEFSLFQSEYAAVTARTERIEDLATSLRADLAEVQEEDEQGSLVTSGLIYPLEAPLLVESESDILGIGRSGTLRAFHGK
jgi:hypothetical protein